MLAGVLATARVARAQDFKQYVGKSPCEPGIQSEYSDFGLRLDKTQQLELVARYWDKAQVVFIIQANQPSDGCGVIRDVIQITHVNTFGHGKHFEFRCFDAQAPTDVIVATIMRKYGNTKDMPALDAWRIDLKEQKFIETSHKVVCSADGWAGEYDGSDDMVDDAKTYAAHHKPGQFASEPPVLPKGTPVTPLTEVRMDGKVIEGVRPKYPEEFLTNRVTGTAVLHVILRKDGTVRQVDVVSGHPVFVEAAIEAVRPWKNQPTLLNGEPVEVDTLIYFKFMLRPAQDTSP